MSDLETLSDGRYHVIEPLGAGGSAVVHLVEEAATEALWAAKEHRLRAAPDWKVWELFERGARVLRRLDHPGIPRFKELLRDEAGEPRLWLIEEYIPGDNLRDLVAREGALSIAESCRIGRAVLSILGYLHALTPPVVHRDVKPSNIIHRPDGSLALVDFGAVQEVLHQHTLGGSTVVGTFGYMPPEQYMGKAEPRSDLYALGVTLVYLLTGRAPDAFEVRDMRPRFEDALRARIGSGPRSQRLASTLRRLIEPRVEKRVATAHEASRALGAFVDEVPRKKSPTDPRSDIHAALEALIAAHPPSPDGEPDAGGDSRKLRCPGCGSPMTEREMGRYTTLIDVCYACQGLWVDRGELEELAPRPMYVTSDLVSLRKEVNAWRQRSARASAIVYRRCPICQEVMSRRNFGRVSGIIIDECHHGSFLEASELPRIQAFVAAGGLEITDAKDKQDKARKEAHERTLRDMVERRERRSSGHGKARIDANIGGILNTLGSLFGRKD